MILPMFPLGSVLFPAVYLPLRVFEPRYRKLTIDCLAGDREFGVALIDRGRDVGGGDHRTDLATVARIVEAQPSPDGRWSLGCVGTRRLRVVRWLEDDPYPRAEVVQLPEPAWTDAAAVAFEAAERLVRRSLALLAELDLAAPPIGVELSPDPEAAAWQLCAISPLGPLDRQRLLALGDPVDRLGLLTSLMEEECEVLALRLAGG